MATLFDLTLPRGRTNTILFPYQIGGVDTVPSGFTDIRLLGKLNSSDPDRFAVLTKSYLSGGITVVNTVVNGITYRLSIHLDEVDTAAPAIVPSPGTIVLYLGLVVFTAGSPLVGDDLFNTAVPTLTLTQGIVFATS
jgi:hypothetical protein